MVARRASRGGKTTITPETGIVSDFSDVEEREGGGIYEGPAPTPGLYKGKLTSVGKHTTSEDAVVWTFDITEGKYDGWRGWLYTNNSTAKWKQQDILVALGLCEKQGKFSGSYEEILRKGGPVRLRVIAEPYQGETTAKIRTVLAPAEPADDADDSDEEDPDFQDEEPKTTRAASRRKAKDPEPEPDDEDDDSGDGDDREALEEELTALSLAELKKAAKEAGFALADYRGKKPEEIVELILDKEFPEGDDEEGEGIDLDALEEELGELDLAGLVAKAKEFGLWSTRAEKKKVEAMEEDKLVDAILDKAEEMDPGF